MTAAAILRDLRAAATPETAAALPRFFKTGPGEYGEGECGKRDPDALRAFLSAHWSALPRTSLRYAIERFAPAERARWLAGPAG